MHIKHGNENILVLHGGPGAIGSARSLAKELGAVEVLNYGQSIQAQLDEIVETVDQLGLVNPVVIGHSWGAWLAYIYASEYKVRYPVSKVILIGCGAFDEKYLSLMQESRYGKLTADEQNEANLYFNQLSHGKLRNLSGFNRLMSKMDAYEMTGYDDIDAFDYEGHQKLMGEIRTFRKSGELLEMGKQIESEVIVFHGIDDPHPLNGVVEPFEQAGILYKLYTFDKCGHTPWFEKHAQESFYKLLWEVLNS